MGVVILLDMLPVNYLALVAMVLFFLWCITFVSQAARKKKGIPGKLYSFVIVAVLVVGTYYVGKTNDMFAMITSGGTKVDSMVVAVLADDPAETLEETADYVYGVQFSQGADNMQSAVLDIQDQLGVDELNMIEYDSVQEQAQALMSGQKKESHKFPPLISATASVPDRSPVHDLKDAPHPIPDVSK